MATSKFSKKLVKMKDTEFIFMAFFLVLVGFIGFTIANEPMGMTWKEVKARTYVILRSAAPTKAPVEAVQSKCDDGADNDGDTLIDFPADEGCDSATDPRES